MRTGLHLAAFSPLRLLLLATNGAYSFDSVFCRVGIAVQHCAAQDLPACTGCSAAPSPAMSLLHVAAAAVITAAAAGRKMLEDAQIVGRPAADPGGLPAAGAGFDPDRNNPVVRAGGPMGRKP